MRPFRFLADARAIVDGPTLAANARRAEAMGYSVLVIPDHLIEQLAPIPAMATIAAATERLRISAFVFNNDLRHPAVLAQDLASLDVLSEGRLEIAMGAGWNRPEYDAIGLPFEPQAVRSARLEESIAVLKGCFAEAPFSFRGEHYTIRELDGYPKPVQRPHPPFFIGGGGHRTLALAGREAQIAGLAPRIVPDADGNPRVDPRSLTIAAAEEKIGWVREAAGDRFAEIELNVYPSVTGITITDHAHAEAATVADLLRARTGQDVDPDELLESPHIFIGSIAGLTEKFRMLRERLGVSSIMVGEIDELAPIVERLAGT
jgi:probable F420-dependent oxidoreductase